MAVSLGFIRSIARRIGRHCNNDCKCAIKYIYQA